MINEQNHPNRTTFSDRLAHTVRIVSIPPLMVAAILTVLRFCRPALFPDLSSFWFSQLFLALLPLLAYPLSYAVPFVRKKGRDGQRSPVCGQPSFSGGKWPAYHDGANPAAMG